MLRVVRVSALEKRLARGLRAVRDDLWTGRAAPLPAAAWLRWLRWLPHGIVLLVAIVTTIANADHLSARYGLAATGVLCALAQGVAVGMALWWPVPAWWLSTLATVAVATGSMSRLNDPSYAVPWPWSPSSMVAHAVVLLLLSLRVRTRVAVEVLAVTALVSFFMQWLMDQQGPVEEGTYQPTGFLAMVVFVGVALLGIALRGRREARTQLVEQASLTAEERARRTLLEERSRIARELHDVVAHHMSVISIQAQVAPHLVQDPPEELRENLEGIRQNALEALTELRRVLGVLRSENPGDSGGETAADGTVRHSPQPTLDRLDALIENTRAAGLAVTVEITGERRPLPPGVELSAYRIVQEALSNALRHASGTDVRVELTHRRDGLRVQVVNSAPRFPAPPSPGAGHGLLGMRERAAMLGGTLVTGTTAGGGYAVAAFLPRTPDSVTPGSVAPDSVAPDTATTGAIPRGDDT
ncbi:sensor histidine kinase [Streptomyces cavernae]|uniref:sensor histidine kinase n=1 Tax=Streptomyces cavernae TaxID=2259034 RepID=UPI000FEB8C9C|nr:sensor histidine kinase [Streptomyces cavernae]